MMPVTEMIFREVKPGEDLRSLEPGLYFTGCSDRFDSVDAGELSTAFRSSNCYISFFTGLLLPFYLHNMNNLLVGVTGNIELAGMFMPDMEKVKEKISAAGTATGSLVDFIRDLAGTLSGSCPEALDDSCLRKVNLLLSAACGRSVSTSGTASMKLDPPLLCSNPSLALAALTGMTAWCVLSVGGSGLIKGTVSGRVISFEWEKPAGAGVPHMPGTDQAPVVAALAGGAASVSGSAMIIERWADSSGKVSLAVGR